MATLTTTRRVGSGGGDAKQIKPHVQIPASPVAYNLYNRTNYMYSYVRVVYLYNILVHTDTGEYISTIYRHKLNEISAARRISQLTMENA